MDVSSVFATRRGAWTFLCFGLIAGLAWQSAPASAADDFTPGCDIWRPATQAPMCVIDGVKAAGAAVRAGRPNVAVFSVPAFSNELSCPSGTKFSCTATILPPMAAET